MLHFRPTFVFKPLIPLCPFYIFSLCPLTSAPCSWLSFYTPRFLFLLTLSGFFNGMLKVFEPEALNCFTFFHSIPLTLPIAKKPNLNSSSSFRIPGFSALCFDRTHSWSGILPQDAMHASGDVIIFFRQGLSFSELSTSSLSLLDPYCDYVGVNISLSNSSLSLLNVYAPPIRSSPMDGRTDSFSPSILSSSRNLFILGDFNCHHPLWDLKGTSDPCGEEIFNWVISFDLLPLNDLDIPILLHCCSPDISFAPSFLSLSCFWEVLQDLGSDHLRFLLSVLLSLVFCPNERPRPSIFRKLVGMI